MSTPVWALGNGGFRAVVAPSFGDILFSNALKSGPLPIRRDQNTVDILLKQLQQRPGVSIGIDFPSQTLSALDGQKTHFTIESFSKQCLLEGLDEIYCTLARPAHIEDLKELSRRGATRP